MTETETVLISFVVILFLWFALIAQGYEKPDKFDNKKYWSEKENKWRGKK